MTHASNEPAASPGTPPERASEGKGGGWSHAGRVPGSASASRSRGATPGAGGGVDGRRIVQAMDALAGCVETLVGETAPQSVASRRKLEEAKRLIAELRAGSASTWSPDRGASAADPGAPESSRSLEERPDDERTIGNLYEPY